MAGILVVAPDRVARAGARVDLRALAEAFGARRIRVQELAIGVAEPSLIRDDLEIERQNGVAGQDLGEADRVRALVHILLAEARVVDLVLADISNRGAHRALHLVDIVPGTAVAQADRREIAEHVLADRERRRVGAVVRLVAVGEAHVVGGLAVQILGRNAVLRALLDVWARVELHIDRCTRDHVDQVVVRHRDVITDFLADQPGLAVNELTAALIAAPFHIGAILGQHIGETRSAVERAERQDTQREPHAPRRAGHACASRAGGASEDQLHPHHRPERRSRRALRCAPHRHGP